MANRTVVPFGPQHPVLPEPVHIDLVLEDEKVVEAIPSIGFVHRGLEELVTKRNYNDYLYVFERICGICSFGHGFGYVSAVERLMGVEVPARANYLRTVWFEMSRIHSHLLWLGLLADAFGFDALFMQCWRMREKVLDMLEVTTGGRVIFSVNKIGGVLKDIEPDMMKNLLSKLGEIEKELKKIAAVFLKDKTVAARLRGVGVLSKENAVKFGAVGPMARASGIEIDTRKLGYAAYDEIDFDIITSQDCDGYARCEVRIGEIFQSIDIIRKAAAKLPDTEISVPVKGNPPVGEAFFRCEQPRGEAIYYVKGNGTQYLSRARIRTPTFTNIESLINLLPGSDFADVGLQVLTIDPCISCTER